MAHHCQERIKVVGLPEQPHWCACCKTKSLVDVDVSTGSLLEDPGSNICRLVQTDTKVFSQKPGINHNLSQQKTIPRICQKALEKDLVKPFKDISRKNHWNICHPNSDCQQEIVLHGCFSCKNLRGNQNHLIRHGTNFRDESLECDFVAEECCEDNVPRANKKEILPQTATPFKVVMLCRDPMDSD